MNIELIMPCEMYWDSYKDAYEEMDHKGCVKGMDWDGESVPEVYFQDAQNMRDGRELGDLVPATNFWIILDNEYVGRMSIRHELNVWLRNYGGHIGYEVKLSARRRGVATKALALALDYCRDHLNLSEVMLTCDDKNIASIKTIEKNGGLLSGKKNDQSGRLSRYYRIKL